MIYYRSYVYATCPLSQSAVELTSMTKRALTYYIEDTYDLHSSNDYRLAIICRLWGHMCSSL